MEKQLRLVVDRGNSRIKAGVFKGSELIWSQVFSDWNSLEDFLEQSDFRAEIGSEAILADTSGVGNPKKIGSIHLNPLKSYKSFPIKISYQTPESLGDDRIANACAGANLYPNTSILVIDAGTCLTFEMIVNSEFIGGAISPGLHMRYRALHDYTGKLPLIESGYRDVIIGNNTSDNIHSGAFHGAIIETQKRIEECQDKFSNLRVILTGGDLAHFEMALKSPIFADANLTLLGLNEILRHNNA